MVRPTMGPDGSDFSDLIFISRSKSKSFSGWTPWVCEPPGGPQPVSPWGAGGEARYVLQTARITHTNRQIHTHTHTHTTLRSHFGSSFGSNVPRVPPDGRRCRAARRKPRRRRSGHGVGRADPVTSPRPLGSYRRTAAERAGAECRLMGTIRHPDARKEVLSKL